MLHKHQDEKYFLKKINSIYIVYKNINYNYQNKTISSIQGIKSSILYKLD